MPANSSLCVNAASFSTAPGRRRRATAGLRARVCAGTIVVVISGLLAPGVVLAQAPATPPAASAPAPSAPATTPSAPAARPATGTSKSTADKHRQQDIVQHRAMSAAHEEAAKCLEAGRPESACHEALQKACRGIAIGKYCGMKHAH